MLEKRLLFASKILGLVIISGILFYFAFRGSIFNYFLTKVKGKFSQKYQCELIIGNADMSGLSGFSFEGLTLVPVNKDTLLHIKTLEGNLAFWPLLKGEIKFNSILVKEGWIAARRKSGKDNFSFLFKGKEKSASTDTETNYGKIAHRLIDAIFSKVPYHVTISNLTTSYSDEVGQAHFTIQDFSLESKKVKGVFLVGDNQQQASWLIDGTLDQGRELFEGRVYAQSGHISFPYVDKRFLLDLKFDTAFFSLKENEYEDDVLLLKGSMKSDNFNVKHPRIDSNRVAIKNAGADYTIKIGKRFISFELPSLTINKIQFDFKASFSNDSVKKYALQANMKKMNAQQFFNSLPAGLFSTFAGIKVSGDLEYHLDFELDESRPDSVKFDSRFIDHKFQVLKFGSTDFSKMSRDFLYTAYEKTYAVRSFIVGPENPMFTPISAISPFLKSAVLQSEDGSFYSHNGFREDAFRMAIAANVKEGRFARGGSTISMQLIKNVFLSRKKTVARKLEEVLIVWLIEKKRLTSKERMYEVYLNIIEWGPSIYGVKEASLFYFDKSPSDLSIEESIFMASIIPRPKGFKYSFDEKGNLRPYLVPYFNKLGDLLLRREIINEEQRAAMQANVQLKGPAKFLVVKDTVAMDSTETDFYD